jgi:hypothetical protein
LHKAVQAAFLERYFIIVIEIIEANDRMACLEKMAAEVVTDEACGAGKEDCFVIADSFSPLL